MAVNISMIDWGVLLRKKTLWEQKNIFTMVTVIAKNM